MIKSGREIGIRTPGCFHINGFQDRRFRPLSHLPIIQLKSLTQFFLLPKKLCHESFLLSTLRLFWYLRQQLCFNQDTKNKRANNAKEKNFIQILLEATPRFELGIKDLQSHALATWLCRQKLSYDFSKSKLNFA